MASKFDDITKAKSEKAEATSKKEPGKVLVFQGAAIMKGGFPQETHQIMTLSTFLRTVIEGDGATLETYFQKNAFARRDTLKVLVAGMKLEKSVVVLAPNYPDPDERAFLAALAPYTVFEVVGTNA